MQISKSSRLLFSLCLVLLAGSGCKQKDPDLVFELNPEPVTQALAQKDREKTLDQYIAILYANLFQEAIPTQRMVNIRQCISSIGDKDLARRIIISNLMNDPNVRLPSQGEMQASPEEFVKEAYRRFLIREPSQAELAYLINFIDANPQLKPEHIYFSFALSNEYQFF
ncbi:MAG: hypothetical protein AAFV07_21215 [Bacteroidota bacterium]